MGTSTYIVASVCLETFSAWLLQNPSHVPCSCPWFLLSSTSGWGCWPRWDYQHIYSDWVRFSKRIRCYNFCLVLSFCGRRYLMFGGIHKFYRLLGSESTVSRWWLVFGIILCLLLIFFFLLVETDRAKHQTNYENPLDVEVSNREYCAVDSLGRFSSGIKNTWYKWKMLLSGLPCVLSYVWQ